ncbi:MAG TPA: hypothetical protein VKV05_12335 [Terriglobales bacterium]|nr:hypothetical protein [Terriglobales bacterium]
MSESSAPHSSQTETASPSTEKSGIRRSFRQKAAYALKLLAVNFLVFAVSMELASTVLVHLKKWPLTRPTYHMSRYEFWGTYNPVFGMWHPPNGHFLHQEGCFSFEYSTNSYGARDMERSLHSDRPRTVVLGDSFIEGFGLPVDERLTNLLEKRTGREHLNFGTGGGFSPLQYALVYRSLASKFDHDIVLVGVLPDNDFHEMDGPWMEDHYPGRYFPYYRKDLSVGYMGTFHPNAPEGFWKRVQAFFRSYFATYHVIEYILATRVYSARFQNRVYSGFNDYTETDLARLKKALLDIKHTADAHGAVVDVFLIPRPSDFKRFRKGEDRLGPVMEAWGRQVGIRIKDLLPEMEARSKGDYRPYFLPCDDHWSAYGSEVAADILQPWIYGKQATVQ